MIPAFPLQESQTSVHIAFLKFVADHRIALGGEPAAIPTLLSVKYTLEVFLDGRAGMLFDTNGLTPEAIDAELAAAFRSEVLVELTQTVYSAAHRNRIASVAWDAYKHRLAPDCGMGVFRDLFEVGLDRTDGGVAVVSPDIAIMLEQAGASLERLDPTVRCWTPHDYEHGRGVVVVDSYAGCRTPVLFAQPGWATVGYRTLMGDGGEWTDPLTLCPTQHYTTDLNVQVDETKIKLLRIDPMVLGGF